MRDDGVCGGGSGNVVGGGETREGLMQREET